MGIDFLPKRIKGDYYRTGSSLQQVSNLKEPALTCSDIKFLASLGFKVTTKCQREKKEASLKEQN